MKKKQNRKKREPLKRKGKELTPAQLKKIAAGARVATTPTPTT